MVAAGRAHPAKFNFAVEEGYPDRERRTGESGEGSQPDRESQGGDATLSMCANDLENWPWLFVRSVSGSIFVDGSASPTSRSTASRWGGDEHGTSLSATTQAAAKLLPRCRPTGANKWNASPAIWASDDGNSRGRMKHRHVRQVDRGESQADQGRPTQLVTGAGLERAMACGHHQHLRSLKGLARALSRRQEASAYLATPTTHRPFHPLRGRSLEPLDHPRSNPAAILSPADHAQRGRARPAGRTQAISRQFSTTPGPARQSRADIPNSAGAAANKQLPDRQPHNPLRQGRGSGRKPRSSGALRLAMAQRTRHRPAALMKPQSSTISTRLRPDCHGVYTTCVFSPIDLVGAFEQSDSRPGACWMASSLSHRESLATACRSLASSSMKRACTRATSVLQL